MSLNIATTRSRARCDNITVTTDSGQVYNLGKPDSVFFKPRVFIYKLRRKI